MSQINTQYRTSEKGLKFFLKHTLLNGVLFPGKGFLSEVSYLLTVKCRGQEQYEQCFHHTSLLLNGENLLIFILYINIQNYMAQIWFYVIHLSA